MDTLTLIQTYKKPIPKDIVEKTLSNLPKNVSYQFYNDNRRDEYMKTQTSEIYNLFKKLKHQAHKTDIFRYCILYEFGGIYVDADSIILQPINPSLFENDCIFIYDKRSHNIFTGFIYTKKHNPIIKKVIDYMIKDNAECTSLESKEFDTLGYKFHYNIDALSVEFQKHYNIRFKNGNILNKYSNLNWNVYLYTDRDRRYIKDEQGKKIIILKNDRYPKKYK